jgi:hypothetical protein
MSILLAILVGVLISTVIYAVAGYVPHARCL